MELFWKHYWDQTRDCWRLRREGTHGLAALQRVPKVGVDGAPCGALQAPGVSVGDSHALVDHLVWHGEDRQTAEYPGSLDVDQRELCHDGQGFHDLVRDGVWKEIVDVLYVLQEAI